MNRILILLCWLVSISHLGAQNVFISNEHNPNEPSIIMDPLRPNVLIAASNLNNYYLSQDTGRTWEVKQLQSSFGVWGDPALAVDTAGDFYFFHLSNPPNGNWIDRIVCQKTTDGGNTWNDGSYTGLNGTKAQDKQWPVVDRTNNMIYLTWTQFDVYGSTAPADSSIILFSKSSDAGLTWSSPKRINKIAGDCIDSDKTVEGAVPAIGPNGELYVVWAGPNGLVFNRSLDQGESWLPEETPVDPMPGGWDHAVSGIYRANSLPVTVCDLSQGPHRGAIYVNWTDQRHGASDTDVWLIKSTNGGQSWSTPIRVNDDATQRQQFFTWMTVDQSTGYLYFVFYDRRDHADDSTDVYLAMSRDGGETFINRRISASPFLPDEHIFFGDYTNITAHNGIVRPIWTRLQNGQLSIWTHLTTESEIIISVTPRPLADFAPDFESYPNPTGQYFFVSYKLHGPSKINLTLLDTRGKTIHHVLRNERKGYGKYIERIDLAKLNIPSGVYFLRLDINGSVKTLEQIVIEN